MKLQQGQREKNRQMMMMMRVAIGMLIWAEAASITNGFVTTSIPCQPNRIEQPRRRPQPHRRNAWPWNHRQHDREPPPPSEKDEYYKRLVDASRDPVAFEKFVMAKDGKVAEQSASIQKTDASNDPTPGSSPTKGYQRIEEWDAQRTKDDMSWEERVQFDGRRYGNQYQQNEILRKNLKSF
jgi:hypothetical protein